MFDYYGQKSTRNDEAIGELRYIAISIIIQYFFYFDQIIWLHINFAHEPETDKQNLRPSCVN